MKSVSLFLGLFFSAVSLSAKVGEKTSTASYNDVRSPALIYSNALQTLHEADIHRTPELKQKAAAASARDFAKFMKIAYLAYFQGEVSDLEALRAHSDQYTERARVLPQELQKMQLEIIVSELSQMDLPKFERDLSAEMETATRLYGELFQANLSYKMGFFSLMTVAFLGIGDPAVQHVLNHLVGYGAVLAAPELLAAAYGTLRFGMRPSGYRMTPAEDRALREIRRDLARLEEASDMHGCQLLLTGASGGGLQIEL